MDDPNNIKKKNLNTKTNSFNKNKYNLTIEIPKLKKSDLENNTIPLAPRRSEKNVLNNEKN
jgi:hypothetical protein